MAKFPENEIAILEDYISENFVNSVKARFPSDTHPRLLATEYDFIEPGSIQPRLERLARARKVLLQSLDNINHVACLTHLRTIKRSMVHGEFGVAQDNLNTLINLPLPSLVLDPGSAFNASPVDFTFVTVIEREPPRPPDNRKTPAHLPAYTGPRPSDAPGERLAAWIEFLNRGPEYSFRIGLLQPEIHVGQRHFNNAIPLYGKLLADMQAGSPRKKFVAIRAAFARLHLGDQEFRKYRFVPDSEREAITEHFDQALRVLQENDVSSDNPLYRQVEAHARQQKAKLLSGLNWLGLRDSFVPVQTLSTLQGVTQTQIDEARQSSREFQQNLSEAERAFLEQMNEDFLVNKELPIAHRILELRRDNASLSGTVIKNQISAIAAQQNFLFPQAVFSGLRAIVEGVARGIGETGNVPLGLATGAAGVGGTVVDFLAQRNELEHQRRTAEIEQDIANNEVEIAETELEMAERRKEFHQEILAFLGSRIFNADFLYLMAEINQRRAERQLEKAILLAYLYERALAFFLGDPNIAYIRFDYLDQPGGIFQAANTLSEDFGNVQAKRADVDAERVGNFPLTVSLRESYPIQFSRFLQDGEMEFVFSFYQFSKRVPASHQCRLWDVGVQVVGLVPPTGFNGTLTHHGRFLVRDKIATLDPAVTRLMPTDEQLAQALEEQRRLGLPVAAIGGVLCYDMNPFTKTFGHDTPAVPQGPPDGSTLKILEGLGPTGLWRLKITDHWRLAISDILLNMVIVARVADPFQLEPKIEMLVRSYERELAQGDQRDLFAGFSLRQNFPDSFSALEAGSANFRLLVEDFPDGLQNLAFKLVLVQALDQQGRAVAGVALEVSRADHPFKLERVTRADGFSEDLDAAPEMLPPDQRFPVIGTWQIRLQNPAQFAQLGDLRLFFMYAFEDA